MMFLLRFLPFFGPLSILFGFGKRVLALKQEKIAHAAVGEPFPVSSQVEIDNHSVRIQMAAWRLAAGIGFVGALFCGAQWRINDAWKDSYKLEVKTEKGKTLMAQNDANQRYNDYTDIKSKYDTLVSLQGAASAKREDVIKVKTANKIKGAKKNAALPITTIVDAADWLRIESAGSSAAPASTPAVSNTGSM